VSFENKDIVSTFQSLSWITISYQRQRLKVVIKLVQDSPIH